MSKKRTITSRPTPVMRPRDTIIELVQDGTKIKISSTFYRGDSVNFYPQDSRWDREDAVIQYIAKGLMPTKPMIGPDTVTVAFDSCFAAHMSSHLNRSGFPGGHFV